MVPLLQRLNDPADHVCWEAAKSPRRIGDPAAASTLADASIIQIMMSGGWPPKKHSSHSVTMD